MKYKKKNKKKIKKGDPQGLPFFKLQLHYNPNPQKGSPNGFTFFIFLLLPSF